MSFTIAKPVAIVATTAIAETGAIVATFTIDAIHAVHRIIDAAAVAEPFTAFTIGTIRAFMTFYESI